MLSFAIKRIFSVRKNKKEQPVSPTVPTAPGNETLEEESQEPQLNGAVTKTNATVSKDLPTFDQLPKFHELTGCAWEVWGKDDQLGTINLLTEEVVQRAAREEVRCVASRRRCRCRCRHESLAHFGWDRVYFFPSGSDE